MEFFEAPAFTRYVSSYLTDDEYREMADWHPHRKLATSFRGQEVFASCDGPTQSAEKGGEEAYGSSTITSQAQTRFG